MPLKIFETDEMDSFHISIVMNFRAAFVNFKDILAIQYKLKVIKISKLKASSLFFFLPDQRQNIFITNARILPPEIIYKEENNEEKFIMIFAAKMTIFYCSFK